MGWEKLFWKTRIKQVKLYNIIEMAGTKTGNFKEIISPYLKNLINQNKEIYGENSLEVVALTKQYLSDDKEKIIKNSDNERHYQSATGPILSRKERFS